MTRNDADPDPSAAEDASPSYARIALRVAAIQFRNRRS
jgi:hypothetical protein